MLFFCSPPTEYMEEEEVDADGKKIKTQKVNEEYHIWKKPDRLLMSWLISSINSSLIGQVTQCLTSNEIWTKLERLFSQRSMAKVMQLRK